MSAATNASQPGRRKPGGQAEADTIRLSAVPHTTVCGQPGNTNASPQKSQQGRRKPGGQPGNTNAMKHGFYSKNFSLAERRGLQGIEGVVLGDEIGLLRVLIRRFAEQVQASQGVCLNESAMHLAVISEAMLRLASLLRTDHMLGGDESSVLINQFNLALKEYADELALNNPTRFK